ncbi:MAG: hypothetical protein QNK37_24425 [Acidobacteriota bacterium]|nr:hypothetical protein [Acidobacteriota bacterium]
MAEKQAKKRIIDAQMIIALSAVLISLCAVFISVYETWLMRKHQRLSVWPSLAVMTVMTPEKFEVQIRNNGTGPALVKSVHVTVDGETVTNWRGMLRKLYPDQPVPVFSRSQLNGRVIQSRESVPAFSIEAEGWPNKLRRDIERIGMTLCYSSIYEECWVIEGDAEPTLLSGKCIDRGKEEFVQ